MTVSPLNTSPADSPVVTGLKNQLLKLSMLVQIEQHARQASFKELGFLMVNDTITLVPYQQAAFWHEKHDGGKIATVSGVAEPDTGAPYILWLKKILKTLCHAPDAALFHLVNTDNLPEPLAKEWAEWFPAYGLWCPLYHKDKLLGGVLLGRRDPWQDNEVELLKIVFGCYGQCLAFYTESARPGILRRYLLPHPRKLVRNIVLAVLVIACLPVRTSVLAPGEIIPLNPAPIRAPFDGVIETVAVEPNAPVHKGQKLFSLDLNALKAKSDIAEKALETAIAQYASTSQEAMNDQQAKSKLAMLQSKIDQQRIELAYNHTLLERAEVTSPIDGVAVFTDPVSLTGKPVSLGERVMLVAPPQGGMLEIQVPVADVVTFRQGADVLFFSNLRPDRPIPATLAFSSYSSNMTPEGVLSYAFRASTHNNDGKELRLGLKGTAKIYGDRKPLAIWILRRPIAVIKQWLTL
jgi:hypothetical protein